MYVVAENLGKSRCTQYINAIYRTKATILAAENLDCCFFTHCGPHQQRLRILAAVLDQLMHQWHLLADNL